MKLTDGIKEQRVIRIINKEDYTLLITKTNRLYKTKYEIRYDINYYIEADNYLGYYWRNEIKNKTPLTVRVEEIFDKTKYLVDII